MNHARIFKLLSLCAVALVGLLSGRYSQDATFAEYAMSSESATAGVNVMKSLPCPPEEKYQEMAKRISLDIPEGRPACDNSKRAVLGKVLFLMDSLHVEAPADWLPEFQNDFKDLLGYVAQNSKHMGLDLDQSGSVAYNLSAKHEIFLGGFFFSASPLEDISTLMHESRHSVESAPGHEQCLGGDIPLTNGGCDGEFSISSKEAGAYSFEVMFQAGLSLYSKNLGKGDREYLMSSALTVLASRFNKLPADLAEKNDVLLALSKGGSVYVVDIGQKSFTTIPLKLRDKGEKITRIDFSTRDSGAVFLSNRRHAYSWTFRKGMDRYMADIIPKDLPIYDFARITAPGEFGRTRQSIKTSNGVFKFSKLLPGKTKIELVDLIPMKDLKQLPQFSQYFLAQYGDSIFLAQDGKLFMVDQAVDKQNTLKSPEELQDPRGWQYGTGGVLYQDLFLLNRAGEMKVAKAHYEEIDEYHSKTTYSLEDRPFRTPSRAVKYFQGLKFHAALTENGRIYVRTYGEAAEAIELTGPDIVDFTIIHNPVLKSQIVPEHR